MVPRSLRHGRARPSSRGSSLISLPGCSAALSVSWPWRFSGTSFRRGTRQRPTSRRSRAAWRSSKSAPPPAGDTAALGALDARVKTLEDRKVETPPDLSDLTSRVTRLEESINALAETAKEGGSVPDAAALDAKIGDLEQRLQGKIDSALAAQRGESTTDLKDLQKEVEALKAKLGALAEAHLAGDTSDLAPQLTTLDQRIAKLEATLPELSTAIDRSSASAKSGAAAIAFANLRNAVARRASLRRRACRAQISHSRSWRSRRAPLSRRNRHPDRGRARRRPAQNSQRRAPLLRRPRPRPRSSTA